MSLITGKKDIETGAESPLPGRPGNIVFMGTPEFAVASLDKMLRAKFNIVGVITAPDKPAGRGLQVTQSAVKKFAIANNLKILQPEKLKNLEFLEELKSLNADLQVVVAFRMLPDVVWNMPPMGTINLHASLLPQYRGAAPINWTIINGEKETGVTTFKLQHEIDTGNILLTEKIKIGNDETAGELHDRMKEIGAGLLVKTVDGIFNGTINEIEQPAGTTTDGNESTGNDHRSTNLKHAPKINTNTCKIDWNKDVSDVFNLIRGLSPYPAAFTYLNGKALKIFKATKEACDPSSLAGEFETDGKTYLKFACTNGYIAIKELQLEGKKRIVIDEFLRGYRF
jgi:methionyl-tRNA formyltransferase